MLFSSHWTWRLVPQHEGSSSTPLSSEVLEAALDAVLGCGAEVSVDYLKGIEHDLRALEPQQRVAFGRGERPQPQGSFVSADQSFILEDASSFTAALERLIFDDIAILELAYRLVGVTLEQYFRVDVLVDRRW